MGRNFTFFLLHLLVLFDKHLNHNPHEATIEMNLPMYIVSEKYLSVTLDIAIICRREDWHTFNTRSQRLLALSRALSPSYLRVGGNSADYIIFEQTDVEPNGTTVPKGQKRAVCENNTVLTVPDWIKLNEYSLNVGWDLIFCLNALRRDGKDWDPTNARKFLTFNNVLGYRPGWELGNELSSYKQIDGGQLGKDFMKLRKILDSFNYTKPTLLVGPDVNRKTTSAFLVPYLNEAGDSINAITVHHYYFDGKTATLKDFLDVEYFDSLKEVFRRIFGSVRKAHSKLKVWLGEAATAWGGGAKSLSDRYVAGFLWLDKLGLSAASGVEVVMRQSMYRGYYSLLTKDLYPTPMYWLNLLYKWLVGREVLKVDVDPKDRMLRIYAHCLQRGRLYTTNGIVIYAINLHNSTMKIFVPELSSSYVHKYLLTGGPDGLLSRRAFLNGKELWMLDTMIPLITPETLSHCLLELPPLTYGFFVFPDAAAPACIGG